MTSWQASELSAFFRKSRHFGVSTRLGFNKHSSVSQCICESL